jgi:uncharacterized protein involved in exopolysaccharide biosynthesis/Mrp family chromosome partitioning ATPase
MNNQTHGGALQIAAEKGAADLAARTLQTELLDVSWMIGLLWRRKLWIAGAGLACAVLAIVMVMRLTPLYSAEARVQLGAQQTQVIEIDNILRDAALLSVPAIAGELEQLRSIGLLERVAANLDLPARAEFNPDLAQDGPAFSLGAVRAALRSLLGGGGDDETEAPPSPTAVAARILRDQMEVSQFGEAYILSIEVSARSPDLAARIANEVAAVYLAMQVESKFAVAEEATEWLSSRVSELRERVESAELAVERIRAQMTEDGTLSLEVIERQITELSSRLVEARIASADASARFNSFEAMISDRAYGAALQVASSAQLQRLVERRDGILQQAAAAAQRPGGGADAGQIAATLMSVEEGIRKAASDVSMGLRAVADIAAEQVRQQESQLSALEAAVSAQSSRFIDRRAIEREAEAQRRVYETFLTRLTETRERGAFQEPDGRIITRAEPPSSPSWPQKGPLVILGGIFGAGLAAVAALALEARRDLFARPEQIVETIGLPLVGALPAARAKAQRGAALRQFFSSPPPDVLHAVERIATTLNRSARGPRVVMVVSSLPREGSTALAIHLARNAAREGRRAVLVDCDPRGGAALKSLDADGGASASQDLGIDIVRMIDRNAARPANASGVSAVAEMVGDLRGVYDVIILDGPPVLAVADSLTLAPEADAVLFTVRWGATPRAAALEAVLDLRRAGAPLVGVVATYVDPASIGLQRYAVSPEARQASSRYRRQA